MTSPRRFEQDLPALLADLYLAGTPDYRDDIVRQTARVRQRPAWTFPERWLPMDLVSQRVPARRLPWRAVGVLALVALLLAGLLAAYVGSQRRLPPPFGLAANGLIAYDTSGDILVRESTTGPARVLIGGATTDHDPWFTPDGTRLTFLRTVGDQDFLMVADDDGGDIRQIMAEPIVEPSAAYAPDGRTLALVNKINGVPRLALIPLDGGVALPVDLGGVVPSDLTWRPPDGKQLLIRGRNVDQTIDFFLVNADGTGLHPLGVAPHSNFGATFDNSGPVWFVDGSRIAYNVVEKAEVEQGGYFRIHTVRADGGEDRALPGPSDRAIQENWPTISPDGKTMLVHRWRWDKDEYGWLAVLPTDGSAVGRDIGPQVKGGVDTDLIKSWSPDGSRILLRAGINGQSWSIDPLSGESVELSWGASALPDWQRKAIP